MTFNALREQFQLHFSFDISLTAPYKLCDYKPCYGMLFEKYLKNYDYWGFCDIDLLLGDVYSTLESLEFFSMNYDKFNVWGHLQIYKNNNDLNTLFQKGNPSSYRLYYKNVLSSDEIFYFDEVLGIQKIADQENILTLHLSGYQLDDILLSSYYFTLPKHEGFSRYYKFVSNRLSCIELDTGEERYPLYAHFQKRHIQCSPLTEEVQEFIIIPNEVKHDCKLSDADKEKLRKRNIIFELKRNVYLYRKKFQKLNPSFIAHKLKLKG